MRNVIECLVGAIVVTAVLGIGVFLAGMTVVAMGYGVTNLLEVLL